MYNMLQTLNSRVTVLRTVSLRVCVICVIFVVSFVMLFTDLNKLFLAASLNL